MINETGKQIKQEQLIHTIMKKFILLAIMTLSSLSALAYDAEIDGIYYNFSGDEAIVTFLYRNSSDNVNAYSGAVVIPKTVKYGGKTYNVTSIGYRAFCECANLTSVSIGNNVTNISNEAFGRCSGMTSITIPGNVASIGDYAFYACRNLTSVTIDNGVTSIGNEAFIDCEGLTSISIPNSMGNIGYYAFRNCSSLTSVTIPESITSIGNGVFSGCTALTNVTIPKNLTTIGNNAFSNCSGLTSVPIGSSVNSIGNYAFSGCTSLTSFTIPNSVTSIGEYPFSGCYFAKNSFINNSTLIDQDNWGATICDEETHDGLLIRDNTTIKCRPLATSVTVPNSVNSIGDDTFYGCTSLSSVTIGNGVRSIGHRAFNYCTSLTSITIPNSVNIIGYIEEPFSDAETRFTETGVFLGCSNLTTIIIPQSVTKIQASAFDGTAWYNNQPEGLVYAGNVAYKYKGTMPTGTQITIMDGTVGIADGAFSGCSGLTSAKIPVSLKDIGRSAFRSCSNLTSINIPENVTSIGKYAFYGCSSLTSNISIPESVRSIESYTFFGCNNLTCIDIPNSVIWIGSFAFKGCSGLASLTIPDNITIINGSAFAGCTNLASITIPQRVTSIGSSAFAGCSTLASITIPKSVTNIGNSAFNGCKLRNVLIKSATPPTASNDSFSEQTFYHTTLYVPTGSWDAYAYDENWYRFINIRETAISEEQLSMQRAYTLMDASTFTYSVYDPVNNCIGTISSVGIDENNPNHSWQMIEAGGARYLYNIGAKKYVKRNGNDFDLTDVPEPIEVEDGDNGIILGTQPSTQWALVSNERMSVAQNAIEEVTAIVSSIGEKEEETVYSLSGQRQSTPKKGINIIGSKKVMIK